MISSDDLQNLIEREARRGSPVLSIYLDTDQSHEINFERGFEVVLKNMLRDIERPLDKHQREEFEADAERVREFVRDYQDIKRGLVICCDVSEDFFWYGELNVKLRNGAWWNETPYVRPLIEILDEYERFCVVLADKQQARLFTIHQGDIEEYREAFAPAEVSHTKSSAKDHLRSKINTERKSDQNAHWHLKHVAELTFRLTKKSDFDRLILAGPVEATSELSGLFPKWLRSRVVRHLALPIDADQAEVLEETLKIEEELERGQEVEVVEELITAASGHERAVLKLGPTLRAIQEQRVWQLVYAEDFAPSGSECTNCAALLPDKMEACIYCVQAVREVDDLVDRAAARVLEQGAKVEQVRGAAATRMQEEGSIGAFLRY
ncbi:MAG: peptide chain release factor subunit 1 [Acidobacteriota bacterium]|jgi:peptide chain release factor subunit 1|nr:peptide chain release factor subunit 1 [Acidobacteriota bacterium]